MTKTREAAWTPSRRAAIRVPENIKALKAQFPVFQTTHFGALVRLLFHELLGLQLRRLLRWSSIGAREGFYLLCSLLLEPWIKIPRAQYGSNN